MTELTRYVFAPGEVIKRANEIPFEQGFANIAHATLKNIAPQLMDHLLGFQTIHKSDDNGFALGVFGVDLNGQLAYCPVIFQQGKLKGFDLMKLHDADLFIPLQEPWINYLLRKRPTLVGDEVPRNMHQKGNARPDISHMRRTPTKYASAESWEPHIDKLKQDANTLPDRTLTVPRLVKESGQAAYTLLQWMDAYEPFAQAVLDCYGPEVVKEALCTGKKYTQTGVETSALKPSKDISRMFDTTPPSDSHVQVSLKGDKTAGLTDDERSTLILQGYVVRDTRDDADVSQLYTLDTHNKVAIDKYKDESNAGVRERNPVSAFNPSDSAVYELITRPGGVTKCVVLARPRGEDGNESQHLVITKDNHKSYGLFEQDKLFAIAKEPDQSIASWFDGISSATPKKNGTYCCVSREGLATAPFIANTVQSGDGDEKMVGVAWSNRQCPRGEVNKYSPPRRGAESISIGWAPGTRAHINHGVMYVPKSWKVVDLGASTQDDESPAWDTSAPAGEPILPGTPLDLKLDMLEKTSALKLAAVGSDEIQINDEIHTSVGALAALIQQHGLREETAKAAIYDAQIASTRTRRGPSLRIKYAAGYPLQRGAPNAPPFDDSLFMGTDPLMGSDLEAVMGGTMGSPVEGLEGEPRQPMNREPMPGQPLMDQVMQAAGSGQREVFDTSVLSSILDSSRRETLVDRYLDDIILGMDRIGRILFAIWTHPELFEEEFGSADLVEVEDGLRNCFDVVGSVVLKLKQRAADPATYGEVEPDLDAMM